MKRSSREWWAWYRKYLESPEWKALRQRKLREVGWRCESCGRFARRGLQCHHLTYARVGREWLSDIMVMCKNCHEQHHDPPPRYAPPQTTPDGPFTEELFRANDSREWPDIVRWPAGYVLAHPSDANKPDTFPF